MILTRCSGKRKHIVESSKEEEDQLLKSEDSDGSVDGPVMLPSPRPRGGRIVEVSIMCPPLVPSQASEASTSTQDDAPATISGVQRSVRSKSQIEATSAGKLKLIIHGPKDPVADDTS